MENALTIYFSHSGNTQKVAEKIQKLADADICRIIPKVPYPSKYKLVVSQARKEIAKDFKPEIEAIDKIVKDYDVIFIGTPNWCGTFAPPIMTFLSNNNFSDKIIMPFCTHGGGGEGKIKKDLVKICNNAIIKPLYCCLEASVKVLDIKKWLKENL